MNPVSVGEVVPGVSFADLSTVEKCEEVFDTISATVASIEAQIDHAKADPSSIDRMWLAKAKHALRIKKAWMPRIQELRGQLRREREAQAFEDRYAALRRQRDSRDRVLAKIAWEIAPETMRRAKDLALERHPELFEEHTA